ncbi:SGNH/GDSL hydrolase family protein [Methylobacterium sp. BTF04]|uniref:SGNH/GDSL hydrolase family protein n=1 Tax=Methylobacterium sp. BTF04 TaxID=2708300 RepID=UPI0013D5368A|nr:SGNH/GDSL hydrolase family protein [Methylobacterium sp. BTF04]NEU11350.1 SGNH/GDSL hydrolase family protein [Methylobacterium sp. BTF04]
MPIPASARPTAVSILGLALLAFGTGLPVRADPEPQKHAMTRVTIPARAMARLPRVAALVANGGEIRIVAFGSSSTEGAGASSPASAYPAQLQHDLEERLRHKGSGHPSVTVLNRGKGGDDSEAMARRLDRDVLADKPDLVIWQTGSNDPMNGVSVERFAELTRTGIAAIRATGADVVLMDQQWCKRLSTTAGAERYGVALHEIASEFGVPVIRRNAMMRAWAAKGLLTPTQMIGPDGLHMTDAGYDRLAKAATAQILVNAGLPEETPAQN